MSKVYPVIHAVTEIQVTENIEVAIDAGVDGVFLINHDIDINDLHALYTMMRTRYPDFWIGLNYLGAPWHVLSYLTLQANGLWMDGVPGTKLDLGFPVLGGVGFKYQNSGFPIEVEVQRAAPLVDVLVTSGPATGSAADPGKVEHIKSLAPEMPLGLASGLTPENVQSYLPWVEWLLVATGVGRDFHHLCPDKLAAFMAAVKEGSNGV